jgi:hypothetical protein
MDTNAFQRSTADVANSEDPEGEFIAEDSRVNDIPYFADPETDNGSNMLACTNC